MLGVQCAYTSQVELALSVSVTRRHVPTAAIATVMETKQKYIKLSAITQSADRSLNRVNSKNPLSLVAVTDGGFMFVCD